MSQTRSIPVPQAVSEYMSVIGARGGSNPGKLKHSKRNTATHYRRAARLRWEKWRAERAKSEKAPENKAA